MSDRYVPSTDHPGEHVCVDCQAEPPRTGARIVNRAGHDAWHDLTEAQRAVRAGG